MVADIAEPYRGAPVLFRFTVPNVSRETKYLNLTSKSIIESPSLFTAVLKNESSNNI